MNIIAVYNMKGGVGKTASAVNLAHLAAESGFRTLLCDLDPQGAAGYYLRIRSPGKYSAENLVEGGKRLLNAIRESDFPLLDLLPADLSFRSLDILLSEKKQQTKRLKKSFKVFGKEYDLVIVDCPANLTLEAENILEAADHILIPLIPTTLSRESYTIMLNFFKRRKINPSRVHSFFSMVDGRRRLHREVIAGLLQDDRHIWDIQIPYSSIVEQMGVRRMPLTAYSRKGPAAQAFNDLWEATRRTIAAA